MGPESFYRIALERLNYKWFTKNIHASSRFADMRIGLYGPYGFGNLGDAAIQQAMIQNIQKHCAGAQIFGISLNPEDTQLRHGIPSFPISGLLTENSRGTLIEKNLDHFRSERIKRILRRVFIRIPREILSFNNIYKFLSNIDLLIISGGGQLDDSWGGAWAHPFSLFKWAVISRIRKVDFIIVSVGAGPIETVLGRFFIKQTLKLANYHSYRDLKSKSRIEDLGVKLHNYVFADLAFSLQIATGELSHPEEDQVVVGISPIAYCDPRVWPRRDQSIYITYIEKLTNFIAWLIQMNYKVIFCPSQINHERPVIEDIRNRLIGINLTNLSTHLIDHPILTVDDLITQINKTDLVIASRYHSVLLSQLLNKPVIALSYDEKVNNIMDGMHLQDYCVSIEQFDMPTLIDRFQKLITNSNQIKQVMERKVQEYRSALDEQYIRIFDFQGSKRGIVE